MNANIPSNKPRSGEKRFRVPCDTCGDTVEIRKSILAWTDSIECSCGHVLNVDEILIALHSQGWNVHDLIRGRGTFQERVRSLPMPHGGSFVAGETLRRSDTADRRGDPRWPFRPVESTRPAEKGFRPVE